MTKNASDTGTTKETQKRAQFVRFVKVKKEQAYEQGTDSQPEVKVEEDEWLESTKDQKNRSGYENSQKSRFRKIVLTFDCEKRKNVFYWLSLWHAYVFLERKKCLF